jgi:hypothetical protein
LIDGESIGYKVVDVINVERIKMFGPAAQNIIPYNLRLTTDVSHLVWDLEYLRQVWMDKARSVFLGVKPMELRLASWVDHWEEDG